MIEVAFDNGLRFHTMMYDALNDEKFRYKLVELLRSRAGSGIPITVNDRVFKEEELKI